MARLWSCFLPRMDCSTGRAAPWSGHRLTLPSPLAKTVCSPQSVSIPPKQYQNNQESQLAIQKILIVDDSPTERYYLTDILVKNGFSVTTAENGEEAFERIKADRPHLILMDVVMPGANGFQVT